MTQSNICSQAFVFLSRLSVEMQLQISSEFLRIQQIQLLLFPISV